MSSKNYILLWGKGKGKSKNHDIIVGFFCLHATSVSVPEINTSVFTK